MFKPLLLSLFFTHLFLGQAFASTVLVIRNDKVSFFQKCNDDIGYFAITDLKNYRLSERSESKNPEPGKPFGKCGYYLVDPGNEYPDSVGFHGKKASEIILVFGKELREYGKPIKCPELIMSVHETASNKDLIDTCFE